MRILLSVLFMLLGSNLAMGSGYIRLYGGDTPLIIAARNRHLEAVELLLETGADVNKAGKGGMPPSLGQRRMGTQLLQNFSSSMGQM